MVILNKLNVSEVIGMEDKENGFLEWWDNLDDIEQEEYNRYRQELEESEC